MGFIKIQETQDMHIEKLRIYTVGFHAFGRQEITKWSQSYSMAQSQLAMMQLFPLQLLEPGFGGVLLCDGLLRRRACSNDLAIDCNRIPIRSVRD